MTARCFFLKEHAYAVGFQRSHTLKTFGGISRKARDGFDEYSIYQPTR